MAWTKEIVHDAMYDPTGSVDNWDNTDITWESLTATTYPAEESWTREV